MRVLSALLLLLYAQSAAWAGQGRRHRAPAARLLGTEFHSKGGAGEIVIHTSGEVELETRAEGAAPVFVLRHCRALRPNDRRPLDTRYFDSPVTGITVKRRGRDLQLTVLLRGAPVAPPRPRKEHGPGGTWYWILSFPPIVTADTAARPLRVAWANL